MYGVISAEIIASSRGGRPFPWVARLNGIDPIYGFEREFIKGIRDYSHANGKNAYRGSVLFFNLSPGIYEAYKPTSWNARHDKRWFLRVDDQGEIAEISREEVIACLKNAD